MLRRYMFLLPSMLAASIAARAQPGVWPAQRITLAVNTGPGSLPDAVGRLVSDRMSAQLGQPVVTENRGPLLPGMIAVGRARNDGYTLLLGPTLVPGGGSGGGGPSTPPTGPTNPPTEVPRPMVLVGPTFSAAFVLQVNSSIPARNVADLISITKTSRRPVVFGSSGVASFSHLCLELFSVRAGVDVQHVPYRGYAPATQDLVAGNLQALFSPVSEARSSIERGQVRALAVTSIERQAHLPGVPTLSESGLSGFDARLRYGVFAPGGTDPAPLDVPGLS